MTSPIFREKYNSSFDAFWQSLESIRDENSYLRGTLIEREALRQKLEEKQRDDKPLAGYIYSLKDLVSNSDTTVTGGSLFLEGYRPPFDASVYAALKEAGAINLVQANLDEFGLGGSGLNSSYGRVTNPIDGNRIIGGSSSGSAYLLYKDLIDFAIASDTGDSARFPASLVGMVGFKPSHGLVSRYGFFPFCSSLDTPSICAASVEMVAKVFSIISFPDERDLTTLKTQRRDYLKALEVPLDRTIRIAVLDETFWTSDPSMDTASHRAIEQSFHSLMKELPNHLSVQVEIVRPSDPNLLRLSALAYAIVAYSESISNYSNLTGLLFPFEANGEIPNRDKGENYREILLKNRSLLGPEFTFRQVMGRYFVEGENYRSLYLQAKRFISAVMAEAERIFSKYDLIVSTTSTDIPILVKDWKNVYSPTNVLNLRLWANFCALPAISIPWKSFEGMPVGLHLMAAHNTDGFLLNFSRRLMKLLKDKCI